MKLLWLFLFSMYSLNAFAIDVVIHNLDSLTTNGQKTVSTWINQSLTKTQNTLGPLQQTTLPIYLKPQYFAFEPVPWASVKRNNPDGLELHIDRYASLKAFTKDWTLYHELSHLYLPLLPYSGFWLSEGFASYMQNVIMRDSGVISQAQFVQRLNAGFERARLQTKTKQQPLNELSSDMWKQRAQQRVYWTGAAFFVEADLALQKQGQNLASIIKQYQACCRTTRSSAKTFIKELDKLSRSSVFTTLYAKYNTRTDFPPVTKTQLSKL
ncbi:hypothetical protein [Pseudoalteromonas carrageenovora]|uniref:M61 family metallopeptidase n=1 Tax=Pseudoalteromonas carrageenovora TaxID=227 RepID=UPI0026E3A416|nr:hypothetical protein [Pseudoalteromonas carrageenovora]MDO6545807.1 hypothetical protein [Pseudoalteromonas carrageenovora]MDO6830266.1 hypothetical protein [Pseudoalteromonas carrageenovora]